MLEPNRSSSYLDVTQLRDSLRASEEKPKISEKLADLPRLKTFDERSISLLQLKNRTIKPQQVDPAKMIKIGEFDNFILQRFGNEPQGRTISALFSKTLLSESQKAHREAQETHSVVHFKVEERDFVVTPDGKVRTNLGRIPGGFFKSLYKVEKLFRLVGENEIARSNASLRALATHEKTRKLYEEGDAKIKADHESDINTYLAGLRALGDKEDFSHLSIAKPVVGPSDAIAGLISPFANGGNLNSYLSIAGNSLSSGEKFKIARHLVTAVLQLHNAGILHRDLKLDNFLIYLKDNEIELIVLTDFGESTFIEGKGETNQNKPFPIKAIPVAWAAPETIEKFRRGETSDAKTSEDAYQLGMTLYCLYTGDTIENNPVSEDRFPNIGGTGINRERWNYAKTHPEDPQFWPKLAFDKWPPEGLPIRDLILGLLREKPEERLTDADAKNLFQ